MTNATNAYIMREKNRRLIINLIRENEISRAEIAKLTSLTKAAVSIIVDSLIKDGTVYELKTKETGVGRHPLRLKLNSDFMYAVGINITRKYAEVGIVNIYGEVLCEKELEVYPKKEATNSIVSCVNEMIKEQKIPSQRIYGVGVAAPGPVDPASTTILNPPNFEEWHYENIGLRLKNALKKDVYLENVSGGLALCEKYFGKAKAFGDFLLVTVNEGIGSGIVSAGRLLRKASEIGHISICYDGVKCECGNMGCMEKYAAIPAILNGTCYKSWQEVIDANDTDLIEKEAEYLACGIINAVNLFGFERVILDGEINYKPQPLIDAIEKKLAKNKITKETPEIFSSSGLSGVVCAAATVFDGFFSM